jgi:hypothetical protein
MSGRFSLPDNFDALPRALFGRKALLLIYVKPYSAKISRAAKVFVVSK